MTKIDELMELADAFAETADHFGYVRARSRLKSALEAALVQGKPYDQQAMELCDECGWKAVMPGEPCLLCSKPDPVQAQTPPPRLTEDEIIETARSLGWWTADKEIADDALRLSRAIEAAVRKQFWGER